MATNESTQILCVDDQPEVLEGLTLHLRRRFKVMTATNGQAGLGVLEEHPSVAVIVSDMRMPGMDGAAFLTRARQIAPDAARILLTGQASLDSAIAAVNGGHIFRFLTKPCPPPALMAAIEAGVELHRLVTAERVLLEETLQGSIKAVIDVLALANPLAFGRASRIKDFAGSLAASLEVPNRWAIDVSAMLSQIGMIILPTETLEKVYAGVELTDDEKAMVARAPAVAEQLLRTIPRLEGVRGILRNYPKPYAEIHASTKDAEAIAFGARILRIAIDFNELEGQGLSPAAAIDTMRGRTGVYDPMMLETFGSLKHAEPQHEIREVAFSALQAGMILFQDVKLVSGPMLMARGYEVTEGFVERARGFARGAVRDPIRVIMPKR